MKVRCEMKTRPGIHAQYEGYIDVNVHDLAEWNEIFSAAIQELRRTAFPDYSAIMWSMLDYKVIGS